MLAYAIGETHQARRSTPRLSGAERGKGTEEGTGEVSEDSRTRA